MEILYDLKNKIEGLESEENDKLGKLEERLEKMEKFLIHNTRGYYLRAYKKM